MFCRKCGAEIPDSSVFCNVCGAKQEEIKKVEIPAEPKEMPKEPEEISISPKKKANPKIIFAVAIVAVLAVLFVFVGFPMIHYSSAKKAYEAEDYAKAVEEFAAAKGYNDSEKYFLESQNMLEVKTLYDEGTALFDSRDYKSAAEKFLQAGIKNGDGDYKDCIEKREECGKALIGQAKYYDARKIFGKLSSKEDKMYYDYCCARYAMSNGDYKEAKNFLAKIGGFLDVEDLKKQNNFQLAESEYKDGNLNSAQNLFLNMDSEYSYGGTSVADRLDTLEKYKDCVELCGKWRATSGSANAETIAKTYSNYHKSWTSELQESDNFVLDIHYSIQDDGKLKVFGTVFYMRFTDYSVLQSGLRWENKKYSFAKIVDNINEIIKIDDFTTLYYKNNGFSLEYYELDKNHDVSFDYIYKSKYKFDKKISDS